MTTTLWLIAAVLLVLWTVKEFSDLDGKH